MKFLPDECLHESLVGLAHAAGFDWALAERIVEDEFTFVTNNRVDFIHLFGKMDLHPGLIVLVPNVVPALQRALFQAALRYATGRDMVNSVIELNLEGEDVQCMQYQLPAG